MGPGDSEGQILDMKRPWKFNGQDYSGYLHYEILEVSTVICNFSVCVSVSVCLSLFLPTFLPTSSPSLSPCLTLYMCTFPQRSYSCLFQKSMSLQMDKGLKQMCNLGKT